MRYDKGGVYGDAGLSSADPHLRRVNWWPFQALSLRSYEESPSTISFSVSDGCYGPTLPGMYSGTHEPYANSPKNLQRRLSGLGGV